MSVQTQRNATRAAIGEKAEPNFLESRKRAHATQSLTKVLKHIAEKEHKSDKKTEKQVSRGTPSDSQELPLAEELCSGQSLQLPAELAPTICEYFPAAHGTHKSRATAENLPALQS